ncbi:MAG TPA: hypothetical protein VGU63_06860 [Candidatus Acidoferrales bacterium]|nr:hypothetical protein [Candidatus Acidoferrales bacterium]
MLPPWPAAAVNLAFYAYFLWVGVAFYRIARGNERVLVAGFFVGILLRPLLSLISLSAAADYIQIVGNVASLVANAIAFVAAVYICKIAARSKP